MQAEWMWCQRGPGCRPVPGELWGAHGRKASAPLDAFAPVCPSVRQWLWAAPAVERERQRNGPGEVALVLQGQCLLEGELPGWGTPVSTAVWLGRASVR